MLSTWRAPVFLRDLTVQWLPGACSVVGVLVYCFTCPIAQAAELRVRRPQPHGNDTARAQSLS